MLSCIRGKSSTDVGKLVSRYQVKNVSKQIEQKLVDIGAIKPSQEQTGQTRLQTLAHSYPNKFDRYKALVKQAKGINPSSVDFSDPKLKNACCPICKQKLTSENAVVLKTQVCLEVFSRRGGTRGYIQPQPTEKNIVVSRDGLSKILAEGYAELEHERGFRTCSGDCFTLRITSNHLEGAEVSQLTNSSDAIIQLSKNGYDNLVHNDAAKNYPDETPDAMQDGATLLHIGKPVSE